MVRRRKDWYTLWWSTTLHALRCIKASSLCKRIPRFKCELCVGGCVGVEGGSFLCLALVLLYDMTWKEWIQCLLEVCNQRRQYAISFRTSPKRSLSVSRPPSLRTHVHVLWHQIKPKVQQTKGWEASRFICKQPGHTSYHSHALGHRKLAQACYLITVNNTPTLTHAAPQTPNLADLDWRVKGLPYLWLHSFLSIMVLSESK